MGRYRTVPYEPLRRFVDFEETIDDAACRLGVHVRELYRWRKTGQLTLRAADHVAVGLGTHPSLLWGDDWWQA